MAASGTLPQDSLSRKSPIGRRGVLTLTGFGIKIRMQAGHLEVEDGIGPERRTIRLARIGHTLKRLVCISEDGFATLGALKWISDVGASFVLLNRNGKVLFATGPNAPSDVRLRRAQAVAHTSGAALGLDPGLGVLHADTKARDSLACDLMEPARAQVDAYLLGIMREPLKRQWFFEMPDGNCRLTASFTAHLSETAPMWGRAVAPFAEWVTRALWSSSARLSREPAPPTRLTQRTKREVKGASPLPPPIRAPQRENLCRGCGNVVTEGSIHCTSCAAGISKERMLETSRKGRIASKSPQSRARVAATQRKQAAGRWNWQPSSKPDWLTDNVFKTQIQPRLGSISLSQIASAIGVSLMYASDIRRGRRRPHPRHWQALAKLVGVAAIT